MWKCGFGVGFFFHWKYPRAPSRASCKYIWVCICESKAPLWSLPLTSPIPPFNLSSVITAGFLFYSGALYLAHTSLYVSLCRVVSYHIWLCLSALDQVDGHVWLHHVGANIIRSNFSCLPKAEWESIASIEQNSILPVSKDIWEASVFPPMSTGMLQTLGFRCVGINIFSGDVGRSQITRSAFSGFIYFYKFIVLLAALALHCCCTLAF